MIIDLIHNKIVADTISSGFERSFEKILVPALVAKYAGREICVIQMYEDYISDNFKKNGYWYYPLTVAFADGYETQWVRWSVNDKDFEGGVPYSYTGSDDMKIELAEAPEGFEDKLAGRARFCEDGLIKIRVEAIGADSIKLSGKYSQTFIDELARQITLAIGTAMSVEGLANSSLELSLVFAPGTFMEHISENVTYRRLTLSDKSSAPRDFWIKWTKLDGAVAHSVASHVTSENILFELGEDVSQKVREKEYRYLLTSGMDKYHGAMSRKNVTEWREIIKRAIRRGELEKVELEIELSPETRALEEKIADVLGITGNVQEEPVQVNDSTPAQDSEEFERAMQKMREITLGVTFSGAELSEEVSDKEENAPEEAVAEDVAIEEAEETAEAEETVEAEEEAEEDEEPAPAEEAASDAVVFDSESDDSDDYEVSAEQGQVELFDEEEDAEEEEDEERDELDEFYAEEEKLEVSEGAVAATDAEAEELAEITRLAMEAIKEVNAKKEEAEEEFEDVVDEDTLDDESDEETLEELRALDPDDDEELTEETAEETVAEETVEDTTEEEAPAEAAEAPAEEIPEIEMPALNLDTPEVVISAEREEDIRAEVETKIRLEYESRARIAAEQEAARLRREQELQRTKSEKLLADALQEQNRLRLEYEKLRQETLRINAERDKQDALRRAEEERLRAQIEAQLRQEARERERLAEAARLAIAEQRRLEEENERMEKERLEAARRAEEEKLRKMEEERIARERAAEAERIRRDQEEARRAAAAAAAAASAAESQSCVNKTVKFIFRRSVDPNITTRIHEIIKATIDYYGKEKIFMKIRASIPDNQTVCLEFLQLPSSEMELLSNIIKILGNSGLGIAKAIVE